jgi:phosphatidylethanolamine-binding protein (PEBP) family uncharacterized protein
MNAISKAVTGLAGLLGAAIALLASIQIEAGGTMKAAYLTLLVMAFSMPAAAFEADFTFAGVRPCAGGAQRITPSPEFRLTDVPAGTTALDFFLLDLTANFEHGGRRLDYAGEPTIAADTFKYIGPCPPLGATHTYQWTIRALDGSDAELGKTWVKGTFTGQR